MNTAHDRQLKRNLGVILSGCLVAAFAVAADERPAIKTTQTSGAIRPADSAEPVGKPGFQYKLSEQELNAIIAKHRPVVMEPGAMENNSSQLEAVVVTSPAELVPMHSPAHEVWGGLAAPFWAIAHPTQAWRIFLPITPE